MELWHTHGSPNLGEKTRPYNNQQKKRELTKLWTLLSSANHRIKLKESEKYTDLARELKKTVEHESENYINRDWCSWYGRQRIIKGTGGLGIKRTSGDHPNYITENGQNTEKSPGDLRRLAVTQTPVKYADEKKLSRNNNNNNNNK